MEKFIRSVKIFCEDYSADIKFTSSFIEFRLMKGYVSEQEERENIFNTIKFVDEYFTYKKIEIKIYDDVLGIESVRFINHAYKSNKEAKCQ